MVPIYYLKLWKSNLGCSGTGRRKDMVVNILLQSMRFYPMNESKINLEQKEFRNQPEQKSFFTKAN